MTSDTIRCGWATSSLLISYHDHEWGVPVHDDRSLFEMLVLEGAQAGLSWEIILRKRPGYRAAFADFDPAIVAEWGEPDVERLMGDPGIVRNRLKIQSAILNASATLRAQEEFGSLDALLWGFVDGQPRQNHPASLADIPSRSAESEAMSRELLRRGFKFVGPTICYAFMQAVGMVNDHVATCFRQG
jgi:DNA-3-methyladenine glycosylase I